MRRLIASLAVAAIACGGSAAPPDPPAAKGPTPCTRAGDHLVELMLARLPKGSEMPTEQADAFRNLIRVRCEQDAWSAAATQCLATLDQIASADTCARLMTEDQQAALVRDQAEMSERARGQAPASPAESPRP